MKVGDLVQWTVNETPPRRGIIVGFDDERTEGTRLRVGGPEDQATIQVMWTDMKIRWECPLDIQVIS